MNRSIARLVWPWARRAEPAPARSTGWRDDLLALLDSWDLELSEPLKDDTSLIKSGIFDSLALWNLLLWVEEQIGRPVDPTSIDLVEEWDTVADVIRFLERHAGAAAARAR